MKLILDSNETDLILKLIEAELAFRGVLSPLKILQLENLKNKIQKENKK